MESSKKGKVNVLTIAGIVLGLIGAFPVLIDFFKFSSTRFSNYFYQSLAENNPYNLSGLILTMMAACGLMWFWFYARRTVQEIKKLFELPEKKEPIKELKDTLAYEGRLRNYKRQIIFFELLSKSAVIFFLVYISFSFNFNNMIHRINIRYKNSTTILLPYIGQDEVNRLNSSWALMKNEADFDLINSKLNEYVKKNLLQN